ncbi:hypothetical protein VRU48_09180 [Pedobacter sp. KR3-3]|uniref:Lipoprotein n=1 Tax=Pedobacter albus TaxID=3113905 RepID=A0ABU7I729_9SPHI|nr:hypothetical protein [Pedobacter sp. KR3-3]MEE1945280.1 hypothetical protein [Pedobacter sp. KR3-3]
MNIKKLINRLLVLFALSVFITGCSVFGLDLQEDYDYKKSLLEEKVNMTAWEYLKKRADGNNPNDTVFRWMKKAIDYSGIDTLEYTKPNRTYIFLHNDAIRRVNGSQVLQTNCFFYDYPIISKNPDGSVIFTTPTSGIPVTTTPTKSWKDYDKETVKKYLLYLIGQGEYSYDNLDQNEVTLQSLLSPGSVATKESRLGYMVTPSSVPGFTTASTGTPAVFTFDYVGNNGKGFDPEGKFTLKLSNTADSKLFFNGGLIVRSSNYRATNGTIHVWGVTVRPSR